MRWSAAGRPAAEGADRTRPRALLRAAVVIPLLVAPLVGGPTGTPPAARAAPPVPAAAPALPAPPGTEDATDEDRPVRIDVGRLEPRTVTPGAVVTVAGTLTNAGNSTITDLAVRLQRGDVRTSRAELAAEELDADPATTVLAPFQDVPGSLAPGAEVEFSYAVPAADLRIAEDGVYPVLVNVNGVVGDDEQRRVGELSTYVVQQPVVPTARTAVAWLWPVVERPHRSASGGFRDDDLAASIDSGGRLDRVVAVLERLPGAVPPGGGQPVPALPVTLAVDPALVEELTIMAAGPYAVDGVDGAGQGTETASLFLERLRALADVHDVVALSYADVDADALVAAGLTDVLVRSLPGNGEGAPDGAAPPEAGPDAGAEGNGPGGRLVAEALEVEPRTDVAWAAGGSHRSDTLDVLRSRGVEQVVLGSDGLSEGRSAVGLAGVTAAAHTSVATASGPVDALVADAALSRVVGNAEQTAGGARLAEQRYLAELAVLTMQAPAGTEQTLLIAPPRDVEAGPDGAGAMMAGTAELPWLRPGSVAELGSSPSAPAGEAVDAVDAVRLDEAGLADVVTAVAARHDLAGAVIGDADAALATFDAAVSRTTSVAWRADPENFRKASIGLREAMDRLRGRVTLLAPADGTYSLASSDAPLVLTVQNDLPFAVEVLLRIQTRGGRGLFVADIGAQSLEPGERTTLQVDTEVRQSGGFAVTAELTTPGGALLGERIQMQVKSTAYGSISLIITFGAAALLGLLFLRRLVLFLLRRRRAAAAPDLPETVPQGVPLSSPPTRSPV
ncbi:hypothetical protein E4P39_15370 [Blastococcus sp. CT_GayMR19]|uniref:DUF6049 family protein n=1 Tax=Blastococcus sp. CT_GayMR19 TaxID=2559608 RepID=UPI0010749557|nr:DUF6049 family protein [Blastococcus sp. CT_GayMR19]TFV72879.1 hypothetical protein E4P39_15370 [Blastococcus sp. CT_GayMR19]